MRHIAGCDGGPCPKIDQEDSLDFRIQGTTLHGIENVPGHESVIRIPREVMLEAVALLRDEA